MKINGPGQYYLGDLFTLFKVNKKLIINNSYQREFIWQKRFQRELIISLLKGYPVGSLIIRNKNDGSKEIVDGQQRVQTIINFLSNDLSLNSTHGKIAAEILMNWDDDAERKKYYENKTVRYFRNLWENDQIFFKSTGKVPIENIEGSDEEIKSYFTLIQNQEDVKAGEIISNLPNLSVDRYFDDEFINLIVRHVGWNNNRKELQKIVLGNLGAYFGKLELGSTDEDIIKFANKLSINEYKDLNEDDVIEFIKKNINFLKRIDEKLDIKKAKKRFIKLFLLLTNNISENSKIEISKISELNNCLSKYNSKWARQNKEEFIKYILSENIIIQNDHFELYFEELFYLFQGSKDITSKENKKIIEFWQKKFVK